MEAKDSSSPSFWPTLSFRDVLLHSPMNQFGENIVYKPLQPPNIGTVQTMLMRHRKSDLEILGDRDALLIHPDGSMSQGTVRDAKAAGFYQVVMKTTRSQQTDGTLTVRLTIDGKDEDTLISSSKGKRRDDNAASFDTLSWRSTRLEGVNKKAELYVSGPEQLSNLDFAFMFMPHEEGDTK